MAGDKGMKIFEQSFIYYNGSINYSSNKKTVDIWDSDYAKKERYVYNKLYGFLESDLYNALGLSKADIADTDFWLRSKVTLKENLYDLINDHLNICGYSCKKLPFYKNKQEFNKTGLVGRHAYALVGYDPTNKTVTLIDPHNTAFEITISLEIAEKYGKFYNLGRMNSATELQE